MKPLKHNLLPDKAQDILKLAANMAKGHEDWKDRAKIINKAVGTVKLLYPRRFK